MGSTIEFNDTLNITTDQGFPKELVLEKHLSNSFTEKQFESRIFEFHKPDMRIYHPHPLAFFSSITSTVNGFIEEKCSSLGKLSAQNKKQRWKIQDNQNLRPKL